jgi:cytochrome c biogenesis protein CcmG/thiol:disulfide interchange protein DsbE
MSNRPSTSKARATSARVAHARNADQRSNRWWIIGGVVLAIALALLVAMFATRPKDQVSSGGQSSAGFNTAEGAPKDLVTGTVTVQGTNLPELPDAQPGQAPPADPAVGQAVPTVSGQKFSGEPITIPGAGTPKVVMFVAHWCPHCQKEVPLLTDHLKGGMPEGVDLFAVSTGVNEPRGNYPPGSWLRAENWPVPTLVDDAQGTAAQAYGLSGFPFFTAVDSSGKVVKRASGELTTQQFDDLVAAARSGSAAS